MVYKRGGLSIRQEKALPIVVSSPTVKEGCAKAGISQKQFYVWMKDPLFRERLQQEQQKLTERTLLNLEETITSAFSTLRELLTSKNENVKARAADSLLTFGLRLREIQSIEQRLSSIEEMIGARRFLTE